MIPKRTIQNYLDAPRNDHRGMKKCTPSELRAMKDELPVKPPIWKKLRKHQRVCFLLGAKERRFGMFTDTGTGKSLISISIAKYFKKADDARRFLILIPNKINTTEWVDEIKKHSPGTSYVVLKGSSASKWLQYEGSNAYLVITTYMGLVRMLSELKVSKKKRKKGGNELVLKMSLVKKFARDFDGIIMDESTMLASRSSLPFRVCRQISKVCSYAFILTGTPFGRDPTSLWTQMFLLDWGETLGPNLGIFREAFFKSKINYWTGFPEYTFDKKKEPLLHRLLANRSIRYEADQADLPLVTHIPKYIRLPKDSQQVYEDAREKLICNHGNFKEQKNMFIRMRQISSGFLGYVDDETGEKAQYLFPVNPKLDMFESLITSIDENHKILVFNDFTVSGDMISDKLKELGIKHVRAYGKTKDVESIKSKFLDDSACRVFIVQGRMVFGLNVQVAKYGIFFDMPVPVILRKQAWGRIERQYSSHEHVFIYDLVVKDTVDEQIIEFHRDGRDLFEAIVNGRAVPRGRRLK